MPVGLSCQTPPIWLNEILEREKTKSVEGKRRKTLVKDSFFPSPRLSFLVEHGTVPHRVEHSDDLGLPLHAHEIFAPWAEYSIHIVLKPIFPIIPFFSSLRSLAPLDNQGCRKKK